MFRLNQQTRNKLVHGDITSLPNREQFIKDCDMVDMAIDLAKEKRDNFFGGSNPVNNSARPGGDFRRTPVRKTQKNPAAVSFFIVIILLFLGFTFFSNRKSMANENGNQSGTDVLDLRQENNQKEAVYKIEQAAQAAMKKVERIKGKVTKKEKGKELNRLNQDQATVSDISDNNDQKESIPENGQAAQVKTRSGESVQVEVTNKGMDNDFFGEFLFCKVKFSNLTDKNITAMRGNLIAIDSKGNVLHKFSVYFSSKSDGKIKANSSLVKRIGSSFGFDDKYNEFEEKDRLFKNIPLKELKFTWRPEQIVYEDGTETAR